MRARFVGDPVERLSGRFTNPPSDWFDVSDPAHFAKLQNNSHYETDDGAAKPKRPRTSKAQADLIEEADGREPDHDNADA